MTNDLMEEYNSYKKKYNESYSDGGLATYDSGLSVPQTLGYVNQQEEQSTILNIGKSLYNGVMRDVFGNTMDGLVMLKNHNVYTHQQNDPNYKPVQEAVESLDNASNAEAFKDYDVKAESAGGEFGYAVTRGFGQLAGQILTNKLGGPIGGTAFMVLQTAGPKYKELRESGVDHESAFKAAMVDGMTQAVLEQIGLNSITKKIPIGSKAAAVVKAIVTSVLEEGVTEALQELPDQFADLWAKNPDMSIFEIAEEWNKNRDKNLKAMAYSGAVGAIVGGTAKSGHAIKQSINEYTNKKIHEALGESVNETIENVRKSQINPEYAAATIDAASDGGNKVFIDAENFKGYLQQVKNPNEILEKLGHTTESIDAAVEAGQDLSVTMGAYVAVSSTNSDFREWTKDHVSYGEYDESTNYTQLKKALRATYEADETALADLDVELDKIVTSALNTGYVSENAADGLRTFVAARALIANPKNPGEYLRQHPLTFERGVNPDGEGYSQEAPNEDAIYYSNKVAEEQQEAVRKLHKIKNTYMLAPSGEHTNLSEKQWAMVRTNAFKRMYGNWNYDGNAKINVAEIPLDSNIIPVKKAKENGNAYKKRKQKAAREWLLNTIKTQDINVISDGAVIKVNSKGLTASVKSVSNERLSAMLGVESLFQRAIYYGFEKADYKHKKDAHVDGQDVYISYAKIGDTYYAVKIKLDVVDFDKHLRYKTHQIYDYEKSVSELNDIEIEEVSTETKKEGGITLKTSNEGSLAGQPVNNSTYTKSVAELVEYVKGHRLNEGEGALVVPVDANGKPAHVPLLDDNGEPLVMYKVNDSEYTSKKPTENSEGYFLSVNEDNITRLQDGTVNVKLEGEFIVKSADNNNGNFDIWVNNPLYQKSDKVTKGQFNPETGVITLFANSDASTIIHETGHYFVENFIADAALPDADPQVKKDAQALLDYAGMTREEWDNSDMEGRRAAHEKLAEAFETYVITGKAPSAELRSAFRRFADWLCKVYKLAVGQTINGNRSENAAEITPEVKEVFDRMLACREEIELAERVDGYFNTIPSKIIDKLPPAAQERLKNFIAGAHDRAVEILTKDAMKNYTAERRAQIQRFKEVKGKEIRAQVEQEPFWNAVLSMESLLRRRAKVIANRYLNPEAREYQSWKEELDAVNAELDRWLEPCYKEMRDTGWQGFATLNVDSEGNIFGDEYSFDNSDKATKDVKLTHVSLNAKWYRDFFKDHGRAPTKAEMREIAIDNLTNPNPEYVLESTRMDQSREGYDDIIAEQKAEIEALLEYQQSLTDNKEVVRRMQYKGLSEGERIALETIAESLNMSPDEYAKRIVDGPSLDQEVRDRLKTAVQNQFGDVLASRQQAEQAAREALYNDESGIVLGLEEQLINLYADEMQEKAALTENNVRLAKMRVAQARDGAIKELDKLTVGEQMRVSKFTRAERKAAALAAKATKEGNYQEAARQKRIQLLNHEMVREAQRRKQAVQKGLKYVNKQAKIKRETWGTEYHFNQVAALLARMGVVRKDYNPETNTQTLQEYIAEMSEQFPYIDIAQWLYDGTNIDITNYRNLSYEQFQDIINAFKNLRKVADNSNMVYAMVQNGARQQVKQEAMNNLNKLKSRFIAKLGVKQKAGIIEKFKATMLNADNFFEMMDGWTNGFFSKTFYGAIKHACDFETELIMNFEQARREAYAKWLPDKAAVEAANKQVAYIELGDGTPGSSVSCDKHTLIQMLCNLGNESSAERLCSTPPSQALANCKLWVKEGNGITREQAIVQTKENLLNFLGRYLTKEDVQYAQALIDSISPLWEHLERVNINTKGFAPKKAKAVPVRVGNAIFRGGYFPLLRNGENGSHRQGASPISDTDPNQGRNIVPMYTNTSSSKARTQAVYPVDITRGAEVNFIKDTIHDIAFREVMLDFRNLFNDQEFYSLLKEKLGIANTQSFREMLERCANPNAYVGQDGGETLLTMGASWLRAKTVNAAIMLNFKVALQNFGNVFLYGNSIEGFGYADVIRGIGRMRMAADPRINSELRQLVFGKSVFMKERSLFPDISIREVAGSEDLNAVEKQTLRWGSMLLAYTDNLTALPMWAEAYSKKINQGVSEQEAIDFADAVVRRTLGSNRTQDVASYQRGGPIYKLFTTFQGFFVTQFNQWYREANIDIDLWKGGAKGEAAQRIIAFAASKWLLACLANLIFAMENPFDEDKKGHMAITKEVLHYPVSMTGWVGSIGNVAIDSLVGFEGYGYRMTAIQGQLDTLYRALKQINKAATAKGKPDYRQIIETMSSIGGPAAGVPSQMNKLFWNAYDIINDEMDFEARDLVSRRQKKERKKEK